MTHASVFSGIGGPEIAAAMLGWNNLFHCEINEFGRKVLNYWFPKAKSYEDITKTDFSEWCGKVNVLTGGFPCQPFSYAGKRRGADDDRYLWPHMFRCIEQVRPDWVVAENVAGITTMVEPGAVSEMEGKSSLFEEDDRIHRYRLDETFTMQRICDDIEGHGYSVQPLLIPACAVGAPHRRDRVFILGHKIDTSEQCGERLRHEQPEPCKSKQIELGRGGCKDGQWMEFTHTYMQRLEKRHALSKHYETELLTCKNSNDEYKHIAGNGRWANFPSVSTVYRGDDGLPFPVDHLTIPFAKWRTESLKAYGNAIVPQVMYEIFRAIELVEKQLSNN